MWRDKVARRSEKELWTGGLGVACAVVAMWLLHDRQWVPGLLLLGCALVAWGFAIVLWRAVDKQGQKK